MKDRISRRVRRTTGSEAAAAFAVALLDLLVRAGFSARKLMRTPSANDTLEAAENHLAAIRPRVGPLPEFTLRSPPDEFDASIVVPAYNAEAHLVECLESALGQGTDYRYEIIVVDDGSTDGTGSILDRYRDRKNLSVIRAANAGVATARNRAIAEARGTYLLFLDSDDRLEWNSVELLVSAAAKSRADIVQGGYFVIDEAGEAIGEVRYDAATAGVPRGGSQRSGYPWGKAIRRTMFEKVGFPDGMDFEDTVFALVLFPRCGRYVALSEPVYTYRDNPNGVTRMVVRSPSALDAYWIVPVLLEQRERLAMSAGQDLLDDVQIQFGELLWLRLTGQDPQVIRSAFSAACATVNVLRDRIGVPSEKSQAPYLDYAFRECRFDLWTHACKYGLQ